MNPVRNKKSEIFADTPRASRISYGMKFDLLSVMPYFGPKETRIGYFLKTYDSLYNISDRIVVSVCNQEDLKLLKNLDLDCEIYYAKVTDPLFLPYATVTALQNKVKQAYIYYTEADQVLYIKDHDIIFNILDKNKYIVPQRLMKMYKHFGSEKGEKVRFKNADYVVCNRTIENSYPYKEDPRFYINTNEENAYGGAYLCRRELFNRIVFHKDMDLPTEHPGGFDIYHAPGTLCLKTKRVFDFFVDHLSGYGWNIELAGEKIVPESPIRGMR